MKNKQEEKLQREGVMEGTSYHNKISASMKRERRRLRDSYIPGGTKGLMLRIVLAHLTCGEMRKK